jgi:NADH dehydrogenase FAD-containing subunit
VGAQVTSATPSFEEVALKFVEVADAVALQAFLSAKLQILGQDEKAQVCVCVGGGGVDWVPWILSMSAK